MDHYYMIGNHNIHMVQLLISFGIVLVAASAVFLILSSYLRHDFNLIEMASKTAKEKKLARARGSTDE